jgi:hypothetical protein
MAERRSRLDVRAQAPSLTPLLAVWTLGAIVVSGAALQRVTPVERLFLDINYLTGQPWYAGLLANAGILGWAVAVMAGLGGSWIAAQTGRPTASRFLLVAAGATGVLLADDLLQLHAVILHRVGVPKVVAELLVVAPTAVWLVGFRDEVVRTRWLILLAGLGGLTASLACDVLIDAGPRSIVLEDGLKLLGILAWAQYLVLTAADITRSTIRASRQLVPGVAGVEQDVVPAGVPEHHRA